MTAAVEVFAFSFLTALPDLAVDRLGLDAAGLGILHAARSTGGIIGGIVMAMAGPSRRLGVVWLAMIAAFGLEVMALGLASTLPVAVVVTMTIRVLRGGERRADSEHDAARRARGPARPRDGRVAGWRSGFSPIGHLEMGLLAGAVGDGRGLAAQTARRSCWSRSAPARRRGDCGRCNQITPPSRR